MTQTITCVSPRGRAGVAEMKTAHGRSVMLLRGRALVIVKALPAHLLAKSAQQRERDECRKKFGAQNVQIGRMDGFTDFDCQVIRPSQASSRAIGGSRKGKFCFKM